VPSEALEKEQQIMRQRPNSQTPASDQPQTAAAKPPLPFDHALVTTAFELPGYTIVRNFGLVRGIVVRSRSVFGNVGAACQRLAGGAITLYTELCERTRTDAYERMMLHAEQMGANAVIGMRYDTTEILGGVTEVLCYDTAVTVVPTGPA
jgi:uncharacterized protein YbjQ (UPF0145 family)